MQAFPPPTQDNIKENLKTAATAAKQRKASLQIFGIFQGIGEKGNFLE